MSEVITEVRFEEMSEGRCDECFFYHFDVPTKSGQCRANPPQPHPVQTPGLDGKMRLQVISLNPPVSPDYFCGTFDQKSVVENNEKLTVPH